MRDDHCFPIQAFSNKHYPASDSFSLINDPRNSYSKLYTVDKLGNVWGGRSVLCSSEGHSSLFIANKYLDVNTEIENMKNAVVKVYVMPLSYCPRPAGRLTIFDQSLKAGQPVFFGCDVGQFSEGGSGIMDTELFEYEVGFCSTAVISVVVIIDHREERL